MAGKTTRTTHSYLAGIGASGALLACAVVGFLSLIGAVSVSVWPEPGASDELEIVQLQAPPSEPVDLAEAEDLVASTETAPADAAGGPPDTPDRGNGLQGKDGQPSPPDEGAVPPPSGEPDTPEAPQGGPDGRENDSGQDDQGLKDDDGFRHDEDCDEDSGNDDWDDEVWEHNPSEQQWGDDGSDRALDETSNPIWVEPQAD